MSTNVNNNGSLGKQEISNVSSLPFVSEKNQLSNDIVKEIVKKSFFIPKQQQQDLLKKIPIQNTSRASLTFVLSESTYKQSSSNLLIKKTLCRPLDFFIFKGTINYDLLRKDNTFYVVHDQPTIKNVELYAKEYIKSDGFVAKSVADLVSASIFEDDANTRSHQHIFYNTSAMTFIQIYGQAEYRLQDGTFSHQKVSLHRGTYEGFIDESSLSYINTPQSQASFSFRLPSNEEIDDLVKKMKAD